MSEHDYIIVGAGSAGCVMANKLGADRSKSVLVLEAGPPDRDLMIHIPAGVYRAWRDPKLNWNYISVPEPATMERAIETPRGRVVGGSSSINAMVYMRGHPLDYDAWAQDHGLSDWDYARCLPYFKAGETSDRGADDWRGGDGPLGVSKGRYDNPLYDAFLAAGAQAGQGRSQDLNGFNPEGVARFDATRRFGRRCSAAVAHLRPALRRGNVSLITGAQVHRVDISKGRATGVIYVHKGVMHTAYAGEVVLCGGAINSPQLLMLSGIGPEKHLQDQGIAVKHALEGVGRNLMDHASVIMQYASKKAFPIHKIDNPLRKGLAGAWWVFTRRGVAASNIWEAGGLVRSNAHVAYPDIQYHFGPMGFEYHGTKISVSQAFSIHVDLLRPKSRGNVALKSADPMDKPLIMYNLFQSSDDLNTLIDGVEKTRDLVAQAAFDEFRGAESVPGPQVQGREQIADWIRREVATDFHPCGTCKMGNDPMAVVDAQGRVHGVSGLRVVDASVMPMIVSANLNAPTQMIAARVADYMTQAPQLTPLTPRFAFQS